MSVTPVPSHVSAEHAITVVKRLSPTELRKFKRQSRWQKQNQQQMEEEAVLLACIEKNSRLPATQQRRFTRLRRKRQTETLTKVEETELQALWRRVEQMNVARLEALTKLAQRRGANVKTLMRQLGLAERRDVF